MVDEEIDEQKAARQSKLLAQVMFWAVIAVMFSCAMFGTWAWMVRRQVGVLPPFLLAISSIVMWIGIVVMIYRAWQQRQRRKRLGLD